MSIDLEDSTLYGMLWQVASWASTPIIEAFQALFYLVPPAMVAYLSSTFVVKTLIRNLSDAEDADPKRLMLHSIAFGLLGFTIAYLYVQSGESVLQALLPHALIAITVFFQMLGHLNEDWELPISSIPSLAALITATFCFLFGLIYFNGLRLDLAIVD